MKRGTKYVWLNIIGVSAGFWAGNLVGNGMSVKHLLIALLVIISGVCTGYCCAKLREIQ